MTADLVAFLRERLEEDERIASRATKGPWRYNIRKQWHSPEDLPTRSNGEEFIAAGSREVPICVATTGPADDPQSIADALHGARHDPARALRQVERDRKLLQRALSGITCSQAHPGMDVYCSDGHYDEKLLRLLALPYSDHPDYREEWRP